MAPLGRPCRNSHGLADLLANGFLEIVVVLSDGLRQDPPDSGVNVFSCEFVLVTEKPFKIGDDEPSRTAHFTKKIGCITDQPPLLVVEEFHRHGQSGGRIAGNPPFRFCRQQSEPPDQIVVPTVEAQAMFQGRDRRSRQRAEMTEELDGDESVADDHPVRFGGNCRQKIGQKGDECGGFFGVGLGDGDRHGPGQAHILGVFHQGAKVDGGRLGGLKEIRDAGVEVVDVFHVDHPWSDRYKLCNAPPPCSTLTGLVLLPRRHVDFVQAMLAFTTCRDADQVAEDRLLVEVRVFGHGHLEGIGNH